VEPYARRGTVKIKRSITKQLVRNDLSLESGYKTIVAQVKLPRISSCECGSKMVLDVVNDVPEYTCSNPNCPF